MDRHLRQLERQGSSQDDAVWLQARLRIGEECARCGGGGEVVLPDPNCPDPSAVWRGTLSTCPTCAGYSFQRRLQLAAFCGNESARAVVVPALAPDLSWSRFDELPFATWIKYPLDSAKLIQVRCAWAAGAACSDTWDLRRWEAGSRLWRDINRRDLTMPRTVLEATRVWLDCPCGGHARAAHHHVDFLGPNDGELAWWNNPAAMCDLFGVGTDVVARAGHQAVQAAINYVGDEQVIREAVRTELANWALSSDACRRQAAAGPP